MQKSSKPSKPVKNSEALGFAQRLEVYQIIAFIEDGDAKSAIARARQMLAESPEQVFKMSPEQVAFVSDKSVAEILSLAMKNR